MGGVMKIKIRSVRVRRAPIILGLPAAIFYAVFLLFAGCSASYAQPAKTVTKLTPGDYIEIYQLYSAYSIALDTGNGPGRIATFTPDGTFSSHISNHVPETMDILLKRTNAYGQKNMPAGGHMLTNIHVTATTDGAIGTCYALLGGGKADADGHFNVMPAFYTDTLVKTRAGWRFKTREIFEAYELATPRKTEVPGAK